MENSKIKVDHVSKIFGKNPQKGIQLLKNGKTKAEILEETGMTVGVNKASFEVKAGEIFVIMGLSGSGKSTLVRLLNRLIEPTDGHVYIDGQDIVKMKDEALREVRRKKMSMVFQRFALFPHRTVLENAAYGLEVQGIGKKERKDKALASLELVGLKGYENSYPVELSGGMQQRVGLARALTNSPDVLLMDEAFSALDPLIRKDMQDELLELQEKMEKTIIFITHDLDEALRIGDRIALMKDGAIVQIGTPGEIMTNPANDYVKRFVEDVNLAKVLTAESVMKRPETIQVEHGPRVALQIMKDTGVSSVYAVDKQKTYLGIISADGASQALKEERPIIDYLKTDIPSVQTDTVLEEMYKKMTMSPYPLPVLDKEKRLKGIIKRASVIQGLAGREVKENE
ncbi:glycine betaine/L-proline ABC transporter ATP-binding protein ProV [Metabacillus arenae]|uniref:Quaternary amine transport ATP-binding protein n=1 Tax=Metabacillus arenae TaxID=2771434 RepID=A0A926NGY2_9BACI|nr:glycine betaine/L-proline ABC transporter ATP-binding protein ProV [Metabacillus arenae]MBD1381354.1 glycine betaine/L-proline ABC transporter ATP-binding protein ProV [Metabacillus arenae]